MAETSNIAAMADLLSKDCFSQFGWQLAGPQDQSWLCIDHDRHNKRDHPTDIVFRYRDPHSLGGFRHTYVLFDLKSYGDASISPTKIAAAVRSLCMATECANFSPQFAELYGSNDGGPNEVVGALFVYNHDGNYNRDFVSLLERGLTQKMWDLKRYRRVYVISPANVLHIYRIATDLKLMSAEDQISRSGRRRFFYPDLVTRRSNFAETTCASLESLLGDWLIVEDDQPKRSGRRYVMYVRGTGESPEEFEYLLDMLFRLQLIRPENSILIKMPDESRMAAASFSRAVDRYVDQLHGLEEVRQRLNVVSYRRMTATVPRFSDVHIGFGEDV